MMHSILYVTDDSYHVIIPRDYKNLNRYLNVTIKKI
jgi:hypothetical protein